MLQTLLLQAGGYADEIVNGEIFQGLIGPFVDVMGIPLTALMFFGSIGTAYYAVSGKATMPVVMMILVGGVTLQFAPPAAARFGIVVLVLGLASIAYLAWQQARGGP